MWILFLAVVVFVMGFFIGPYIKKDKVVSFSLKGGLIAGILSVISMLVFGFVLIMGGTGFYPKADDIAGLFFLSGAITFICLYSGAWVARNWKKIVTEEGEDNYPSEDA